MDTRYSSAARCDGKISNRSFWFSETMNVMSAVKKIGAVSAVISGLSFISVVLRGDLMCASNLTGVLILIFLVSGLITVISLIVGFIRLLRDSKPDSSSISN